MAAPPSARYPDGLVALVDLIIAIDGIIVIAVSVSSIAVIGRGDTRALVRDGVVHRHVVACLGVTGCFFVVGGFVVVGGT
ncbi:MAG: hypothetical protein HRT86_01175, partial [Ilumatobacteraceae bacterium]|nr:hypothetical protein [Ilumatobacteraceae bacterium]